MNVENKTGRTVQTKPDSDVDLFEENGEQHHQLSEQAQRDQEIAAMEQHSRHQPPTIQRPPEMAPASPRTALIVVGVLVLVLLVAGALTLIGHASHERALASETERQTIPTVAVVHPTAEKPDEELVLPARCRPMPNPRSTPAPADTSCAGTKTLAAA